jgi:hypothetical protein
MLQRRVQAALRLAALRLAVRRLPEVWRRILAQRDELPRRLPSPVG